MLATIALRCVRELTLFLRFAAMSEKPAPLNLGNQHRRRISLPSTPPETPMREYFGCSPPSLQHSIAHFPLSPPATPTRATSSAPAEEDLLPSYTASQGRRPSEAYAHHRRTSTTTIIRLAVAGARNGSFAFPTKIITAVFLFLSLGYLASFLPSPLSIGHSKPSAMVSTPNPFKPAYSQHAVEQPQKTTQKQQQADSFIGDTAQRKAWSQSFDHRHGAAQQVAPAAAAGDQEPFSLDGDIMRKHPELLQSGRGKQQRRRKPVRLATEPKRVEQGTMMEEDDVPSVEETIDVSSASDSERKAAAAVGAVVGSRNLAVERMKKMAAAKKGSARVGGTAPLDSSAQEVVDSHVFVKGGSGKKKNFKGGRKLGAEDADVARPREIVGKGHPRNAAQRGIGAAAAEQELQQESEGVAEDWSVAGSAENEGDE